MACTTLTMRRVILHHGTTGEVFLTHNDLGVEVEWRIPRFLDLEKEDGIPYSSPDFQFDGQKWNFEIFPIGKSWDDTLGHLDVEISRNFNGSPVSAEVCVSLGKGTDTRSPKKLLDELDDDDEFLRIVPRCEVERWFRLHPDAALTVECTLKKLTPQGTSSKEKCSHCKEDFDADSIASHRKRCSQRPVMCPDCSEVVVTKEWLEGHECQMGRTEAGKGQKAPEKKYVDGCTQTGAEKDQKSFKEAGTQTEEDGDAVKKFSYLDIKRATNNFSPENEIGKGGFGIVYKGEMKERGVKVKIAVKKLLRTHTTDISRAQFQRELEALSSFKHDFLLSLIGYCDDPSDPCLVLPFMTNGSLEDRLACKDNAQPLPWDVRLRIAYCSALGIDHLHSKGQVHRDIKSANILLDGDLFPKVADFGLVRDNESHSSTIVEVTKNRYSTAAYMAPDAYFGDVSVKLDTFSFGVVLLELLSGLPAKQGKRCLFWGKEQVLNMLDSEARWDRLVAREVHAIAKRCLILEKRDRPTISQILVDLRAVLPANVKTLIERRQSSP